MWELIRIGYHNSHKRSLWLLIAALLALIGIEIAATVAIPQWRGFFYDGIEAKNHSIYIEGLWYFAALSLAFIVSQGFKQYTVQKLGLVWRTALNDTLLARWRASGRVNLDNPDQRISEDTNLASSLFLELAVEVIISAAIIVGLIGSMSVTLIYMSAAYAVGVTVLAYLFHRPLIDREKALQRAEADYRYNLALTASGQPEGDFKGLYEFVIAKYTRLINITLGFNLFSRTKGSVLSIVPLIMLVPLYFEGHISFGDIMKGAGQFDLLVINATILVVMYPRVTKALASYERIKEFYYATR
jgi:vitamin B12/bleomycin/antimicrobial peptide transport system ATP-binding/permease protein